MRIVKLINKIKSLTVSLIEKATEQCPLCGSTFSYKLHRDNMREYYRCTDCSLIFVPSRYHLSPCEEKKRYDLHQNNPRDFCYRAFLNKLLIPFVPRLHTGARGIDYGSGPGPTLSHMFSELGFKVNNYDPIYTNNKEKLNYTYDFVTCTETAEHFCNPKTEWEQMLSLIRSGGLIGVMTEMLDDEAHFSNWHYKKDDTHVCFYSKKTFQWLAQKYNLDVYFAGKSVAIFQAR